MVTQKAADADNSQQLWQAVVTGKHVDTVTMYRYEKNQDGTNSNEIIEMHLPAKDFIKYMKRGFVLKKSDLTHLPTEVTKVYGCDWPGCDKEFDRRGSLALHKEWHKKRDTEKQVQPPNLN